MVRTVDKIIHNLKQNVYYSPSRCLYHHESECLCLRTNHDNRTYHCLYADTAVRWVHYNSSFSCDIPYHFHLLIQLNQLLGADYVLPFTTHFREASGYTVGLFALPSNHYGSKILEPDALAETFLTFVLFLCALQHIGVSPRLANANFVYTPRHPVLARIRPQAKPVDRREKAWNRFLSTKKPTDVLHYLRVTHPEFFTKKAGGACLLVHEHDDVVHALICKSRTQTFGKLLEEYKHLFPHLEPKFEGILKRRPLTC